MSNCRRAHVLFTLLAGALLVLCCRTDDAAVARPAASGPAAGDSASELLPGQTLTLTFAGMPPTLLSMVEGKAVSAQLTAVLPRNYDRRRRFPLLVFLGGSTGGRGADTGRARGLSEGRDFICVDMPLFKKSIDPLTSRNYWSRMMIGDEDCRFAWPLYQTMLNRLAARVPNIDRARSVLGGFSNGAHMTAGLINVSQGEVARQFSKFLLVEGGSMVRRFDLIKGKRVLVLYGGRSDDFREMDFRRAASAAGVHASVHEMAGIGHAFPESQYPVVTRWLRQ